MSEDQLDTKELSAGNSRASEKKLKVAAILAEFDDIIQQSKKDELGPFLKDKTPGYLTEMKKHLTGYRSNWLTFIELTDIMPSPYNEPRHFGVRANGTQKDMITLAAIVLLERSQCRPWYSFISETIHHWSREPFILNLLRLCKPTGFAEVLVDMSTARTNASTADFNLLVELEKNEIISFQPQLFARSLAQFGISEARWNGSENVATLTSLRENKAITKKSLEEIFNYESPINDLNATRYSNSRKHWSRIMPTLIEEEFIDRGYVLENSILAQTKDWDNQIKTTFRDVVESIAPNEDELVSIQSTIFSLLQYSHVHVVNFGIELCKKIYEHKDFDVSSFITWAGPIFMRNDLKTSTKITLSILEHSAKKDQSLRSSIVLFISDCFLQTDATIQEKAAKAIVKYGDPNNEELKQKLASYAETIQSNAKILLFDYFASSINLDSTSPVEVYTNHFIPQFTLGDPIAIPKNWNELLQHIVKFTSDQEYIDSEIMWDVLLTKPTLFQDQFKSELEPIKNKLYSFPTNCAYTDNTYRFLRLKAGMSATSYMPDRLEQYKKFEQIPKTLYDLVEYRLQRGIQLTLLSIPTHYPHHIEPKILLERMIAHEESKEPIHQLDLALAIGRLIRQNVNEAAVLLDSIPKKYKSLMSYCLGITHAIEFKSNTVIGNFFSKLIGTTNQDELITLWAVAARTFNPDGYFVEFEDTPLKDIPNVTKPYKPEWLFRNFQTEVYCPLNNREINRYHSTFPRNKMYDEPIPFELIYSGDYAPVDKSMVSWYGSPQGRGRIKGKHSIAPRDSERIANNILDHFLRIYGLDEEQAIDLLNILLLPDQSVGSSSHLILALCFIHDKKSLRLNAEEVMYQLIAKGKLDVFDFGQKAAQVANAEIGVFQRLCDGIVSIKDSSSKHNSALAQIIDSMLAHLEAKESPPTGIKKLLEHFADVIVKNNFIVSPEAKAYMVKLKSSPSLKKVIEQIMI